MNQYKAGYFVEASRLPRSTAFSQRPWFALRLTALTRDRIAIRDLPLYSQDYDADFPPVALAFKQAIAMSMLFMPNRNGNRVVHATALISSPPKAYARSSCS